MTTSTAPVGALLREWRERRRLSQLELSNRTAVSTRHLSWIETGRSRPTAQMILRLADDLEVPLRERNAMLLAAGFAPAYPQHGLDDPELADVRDALRAVLAAHLPHPALLLDRHWDLVEANAAATALLDGCAPHLLVAPVNVLRVSLHPDGLAPRIANLPQWRAHLLGQVRRRAERTGDPALGALLDELTGYGGGTAEEPGPGAAVVPLRLRTADGELALFSLAAHVTTAADVTVEELAVETFHPADAATAAALRRLGTG